MADRSDPSDPTDPSSFFVFLLLLAPFNLLIRRVHHFRSVVVVPDGVVPSPGADGLAGNVFGADSCGAIAATGESPITASVFTASSNRMFFSSTQSGGLFCVKNFFA